MTWVDLGVVEDMQVEMAMRSLEGWRKRLNKLVERSREVEKLTTIFGLDSTQQVSSAALVATLQGEFEVTASNIEHEDTERYQFEACKSQAPRFSWRGGGFSPVQNIEKMLLNFSCSGFPFL